MNLRSLFGGGAKKAVQSRLPQVHAFADVSIGGRPLQSLSVDAVGPKTIATAAAAARTGEKAIFLYANQLGRFRFSTVVLGSNDGRTQFRMPERIEPMSAPANGAQKRSTVRMDALVAGMWRDAPGGKGFGQYAKGNIRDISRGGCSLIIDRLLRKGSMVEVKLVLSTGDAALEVLGEVMREERIATSGKHSHGLRFHGVNAAQDQEIISFINRKQTELRSRGLA
ncbi:MAG: PilZ domain-containing protein [Candidatus Eremiobacteraeota bacterium]|nr:PilZ domain-containing protein [Candidatus Eremiobacteraeota bacterium]